MGYDLTSEAGSTYRFTGAGWSLLLSVAEAYGWKPAGTQPPEQERADEWSGDYDSNDGQRVISDDAANMAQALAAALADPRRHERQAAIARELDRLMHAMEVEAFGEDEIGPYVERSEPEIIPDDILRGFIVFLQSGSFRID